MEIENIMWSITKDIGLPYIKWTAFDVSFTRRDTVGNTQHICFDQSWPHDMTLAINRKHST